MYTCLCSRSVYTVAKHNWLHFWIYRQIYINNSPFPNCCSSHLQLVKPNSEIHF